MPYFNKTTQMGVVDQAPKIGSLGTSGVQVMKFSLRVGEGFGDNRKSHWFNVSYIAGDYKGFRFPDIRPKDHVLVDGRLKTYESTNPNGARTRHVYIEARDIKVLRLQPYENEDHGQRPSGPPAANGGGGDPDIPF